MRLINADALKEDINSRFLTNGEKRLLCRIVDKAPTVTPEGDLADKVWKLYEKHNSHLATHVLEFGDELKELLGKYQKGGAE